MGTYIRFFTAFLLAFLWASLGRSQQSDAANGPARTLVAFSDTLQPPSVVNGPSTGDTLDAELVRAGRNTILLSMLFLMLSFLALGVTIAVAAPFALFAFTAWRIISTSVIVNLYQRSLGKEFRRFLLLTGGIVGMLVSTVGWLILVRRFDLSHAGTVALLTAAGVGLVSGVLLGLLTSQIASWLLGSFKHQLFKSND